MCSNPSVPQTQFKLHFKILKIVLKNLKKNVKINFLYSVHQDFKNPNQKYPFQRINNN